MEGVILAVGIGNFYISDGLRRRRGSWLIIPGLVGNYPILLGALASVYSNEKGRVNTAVWLAETKGKGEMESVAHQAINALGAVGVLDEILVTKEGIIVYPTELLSLNDNLMVVSW